MNFSKYHTSSAWWILIFVLSVGGEQPRYVHRGSTKTCLPVFNCEAGTYVKECIKSEMQETCEPCKKGEFQPDLISSLESEERRKCFVPKDVNDCPTRDTVYSRSRSDNPDNGHCTKHCRCNKNKCFYGDPCFCRERKDPCPKGKQLNDKGECIACPENYYKNWEGCGPCRYNYTPITVPVNPDTTLKPPATPKTTQKQPTEKTSSPDKVDTTIGSSVKLSPQTTESKDVVGIVIPVVCAVLVIVVACLVIVFRRKCQRIVTKFTKKTEEQQPGVRFDPAGEDPILDQGSLERNPLMPDAAANVNENGFQDIRPNGVPGVVPIDNGRIDHYPSQEEEHSPGPSNSSRTNHGLKVTIPARIPEPPNEPHPEKTPIPDNSPHDYNQKPVLLYSNSVEPTSPVEYPSQEAIIDSQPSSIEGTVGHCPASNFSNSLDRQVSDIQPSSPTQCTESPTGATSPVIAGTTYSTNNEWFTPGAPTEHEEDTLCKAEEFKSKE